MARRSLLEMVSITARVPRGEAGYWAIMRQLDRDRGQFTVADVEDFSNVKAGGVAMYLRKLVKGGFASHVSDKPAPVRPQKVYRLLKRPSDAPRLRDDGTVIGRTDRECLWCAIRSMPGPFTARELCFAATTTTVIRVASAERYLQHLFEAGYLAKANDTHWRLKPKMNTGPLAPSILRLDVVYDRNLNKIIGDDVNAREVSP